MDQLDAAIVTLQSPELASNSVQPWTARLRYAYADALLAAGREGEAREWFAKTVESDKDGSTDASDRLAEMDGVEFVDVLVEDDEEAGNGDTTETATEIRAEAEHQDADDDEGEDDEDEDEDDEIESVTTDEITDDVDDLDEDENEDEDADEDDAPQRPQS